MKKNQNKIAVYRKAVMSVGILTALFLTVFTIYIACCSGLDGFALFLLGK